MGDECYARFLPEVVLCVEDGVEARASEPSSFHKSLIPRPWPVIRTIRLRGVCLFVIILYNLRGVPNTTALRK